MKPLRFLLDLLLRLLKGATYEWVVALKDIVRLIIEWLRKLFRPTRPHSETNATNTGCATIDHPSFHRPDPMIYSQKYLMSLGLAVTWDNPDISLFKNGVQVSEGDLLPNTEYEIRATIWNNSYDAPIVGLRVDFSFLSFGVTTLSNPIGSTVVDLGVKGGSQHPAIARIPWITPPTGHYCIVVGFHWVDDANPSNNVGQNNLTVVAATSPAIFTFQIRNPETQPRAYRMEVDTYTLPKLTECGHRSPKGDNGIRWKELQDIHDRASHPVPEGWTVEFTPLEVTLPPAQEAGVTVAITPPASFSGKQAFNVHAVMEHGAHAGGVTVYVTRA